MTSFCPTSVPRSCAGTRRETRLVTDLIPLAAFIIVVMVTAIPAAFGAETNVVNIRFGHYADKVRVVLDLTAETRFRIESSPDAHTVSVILSNVKWQTAPKRALNAMLPLTGYAFHSGSKPNEGQLDLQANRPIGIMTSTTYPPDHNYATYRISFELSDKPAAVSAKFNPPPAAPPADKAPPDKAPAPPVETAVVPVPAPAPDPVTPNPAAAAGVAEDGRRAAAPPVSASGGSASPYHLTGFRSAAFGMTEEQVRKAIEKDFALPGKDIVRSSNSTEKTTGLEIAVDNLLPSGGMAKIGYIFGYQSHTLIQINISWGALAGTGVSAGALIEAANQLRRYLFGIGYRPETIVANTPLADGTIMIFRGLDADDRAAAVVLSGVPLVPNDKAKDNPAPTTPPSLQLSYISAPRNPDIFRIKPGQF